MQKKMILHCCSQAPEGGPVGVDRFGDGDEFGKGPIPVHAQNAGFRAHVGLAGSALEASNEESFFFA